MLYWMSDIILDLISYRRSDMISDIQCDIEVQYVIGHPI